MSVNRKVTVPVGRADDASRTAGVLSWTPFRSREPPIVEPVSRTFGGGFGGATNANGIRASARCGRHAHATRRWHAHARRSRPAGRARDRGAGGRRGRPPAPRAPSETEQG